MVVIPAFEVFLVDKNLVAISAEMTRCNHRTARAQKMLVRSHQTASTSRAMLLVFTSWITVPNTTCPITSKTIQQKNVHTISFANNNKKW